jgi:hypothetical protein
MAVSVAVAAAVHSPESGGDLRVIGIILYRGNHRGSNGIGLEGSTVAVLKQGTNQKP